MNLNTHLKIDNTLNGNVVKLEDGYAKVELMTTDVMIADDYGLIHGGFCFAAADFAAMAAVNDPFVVLAKSKVRFLAPIKVGQSIVFDASVKENDGRKYTVEVSGKVNDLDVFIGTFYTVILKDHVLNKN